MLNAACPQLGAIANLLREKHDRQVAMIVRDVSPAELRCVEEELLILNRMMARHRKTCPQCSQKYRGATLRQVVSILLDAS